MSNQSEANAFVNMDYDEIEIHLYGDDVRYREIRYKDDMTARWVNRTRAIRLMGEDKINSMVHNKLGGNVMLLQRMGITFDFAVPQPWLNDIAEKCGEYFLGWVWVYPRGAVFGMPYPRNDKAQRILDELHEPQFNPLAVCKQN